MPDPLPRQGAPQSPAAGWAETALPADWKSGRVGMSEGPAGVSVRFQTGIGIAALMARAGRKAALGLRVRELFGVDLPAGPACASGGSIRIVGTGPGKWLALAAQAGNGATIGGEGWAGRLAALLADLAVVVELSHAYALFRLDGPRSRDLLAKGVNLDLDPSRFTPAAAATTPIALIGATLWRGAGPDSFHVAVSRSYTAGFCRWLVTSGAEFGLEIETSTASRD